VPPKVFGLVDDYRLLGNVAVLNKHLFDVPVLLFPLQPIAPFEQEDTLT
jgi:hypothetical protein